MGSVAPDTTTECFQLSLISDDEKLGQLGAFGRYWIWGQTYLAGAEPLRLLEWTPKGMIGLPSEGTLLHRVEAGTPHSIEGLFGYWLISDGDHQWLQVTGPETRQYVLIAGGQTGGNQIHHLAWYCPECGAQLGQNRPLPHDGTPASFVRAQAEMVAAFNADTAARTCSECGALHPPAYGFRGASLAAPSLASAPPVPTPMRRGALGQPVARLGELADGVPALLDLDGLEVVLLRLRGAVYAFSNRCPHKGGPLSMGEVRPGSVTCPWHRFRFDLATGQSRTNSALRMPVYRVQLRGDQISIEGL